MRENLLQELTKIKDFLTKDGQRHPLRLVLLLVIMGTMSGYLGYRAMCDFVERHRSALITMLGVNKQRLPSDSTIRSVIMGIDFGEFATIFQGWAGDYLQLAEGEWLAIDAKSIKGTVKDYASSDQSFVSVVSIFSTKQGVVVSMEQLNNKQTSEIEDVSILEVASSMLSSHLVVQALLQALNLEGIVLSLDALHCQKTREN